MRFWHVLILSLWAFSSPSIADRTCPRDTERQRLEALTFSNSDGFFFLRLFNGFWPIPTRYAVSPAYQEGRTVLFDETYRFNVPCIKSDETGTIEYGKKTPSFAHDLLEVNDKSITISRDKINGLDVVIFVAHIVNRRDITSVVVFDNSEYIKITDSDPTFWKESLTAFLRLNSR